MGKDSGRVWNIEATEALERCHQRLAGHSGGCLEDKNAEKNAGSVSECSRMLLRPGLEGISVALWQRIWRLSACVL